MSIPTFSTKASEPKGRPVLSCRRKAANSSARVGAIRKAFHSPVRSFGSGQAGSRSESAPPKIREAALLQG